MAAGTNKGVKNGLHAKAPAKEDNVLADERRLRRRRENELVAVYLLVGAVIVFAWVLGSYEFSFVWIFALVIFMFAIWYGRVLRLMEYSVQHQENLVRRKRALQHGETAEWLNFAVNRWWVFSGQSMKEVLRKRFNPVLMEGRPTFLDNIDMINFSLGEKTPCVKYVKVYECIDSLGGGKEPLSWSNVGQPPAGLQQLNQYQLVFEAQLELHSDDFLMIFRSRFGGKWLGMTVDVAVEKLNIAGRVQMIVHLDMDSPFPHVTSVSASFADKPNVWFGVRLLKMVQIMEIPLLKSWIHHVVMDGLIEALVDPGKLQVNVNSTGPATISKKPHPRRHADGVLTVILKGEYVDQPADSDKRDRKVSLRNGLFTFMEDLRECVMQLNDQSVSLAETRGLSPFGGAASFLVTNLKSETLSVKVNSNIFLATHSLAQFDIPLISLKFDNRQSCELPFERQLDTKVGGGKIRLTLSFKYDALSNVDKTIDAGRVEQPSLADVASGVVYVFVHGATNLLAFDNSESSDPYCVVFNSGKKVKCSHYVPKTRNPKWDLNTEFIIEDVSKTVLSFLVYHWDGRKASEDAFLGSAHLPLSADEPIQLRRTLDLCPHVLATDSGSQLPEKLGTVTVTMVFRPVTSIADAIALSLCAPWFEVAHRQMSRITNRSLKSKQLQQNQSMNVAGGGIIELNIIQGKELMAMDRNGFSDPFCEVRVAGQKKYVTAIKKKTLEPVWNEAVTVDLPKENESLEISVWDWDILSQADFLGILTFKLEELQKISADVQHDGWFKLQKVKSGSIQLSIKVFSDDLPTADIIDEPVFEEPSPIKKNTRNPEKDMLDQNGKQMEFLTVQPARGKTPRDLSDKRVTSSTGDDNDTLTPTKANEATAIKQPMESSPVDQIPVGGSHKLTRKSPGHTASVRRTASETQINGAPDSQKDASEQQRQSASPDASSNEYFGVHGVVKKIKGIGELSSSLYCKIRIASHLGVTGDRNSKKPSSGRVIAKSANFQPAPEVNLDLSFEVDHKYGINKDSWLVFDIKSGHYSHVAVRGYSFRELLGDTTKECTKWLPLDLGIEVKVYLSYDGVHPADGAPRRSHSFLGSFRTLTMKKIKEQ